MTSIPIRSAAILLFGLLCACTSEQRANVQGVSEKCLIDLPNAIEIKAAESLIGNNKAYREEAPQRRVSLKGFEIDATEVTNEQFKAFVEAADYVTDAEKVQAGFNVPGGAVFKTPSASHPSWWQFVEGANWRHPEGPESSIKGRNLDPVVQVSLRDAKAYAKWKGRRLPTQDEWEHAAKGGSDTVYVWGDEKAPNDKEQANTWQGAFPLTNTQKDGYLHRAPVGCFEPNGFGLYDMIGNVWEWTDTPFAQSSEAVQYVIKGGSFLCAANYCRRYRASALQPQDADFTTNHIGFRTVSQ